MISKWLALMFGNSMCQNKNEHICPKVKLLDISGKGA